MKSINCDYVVNIPGIAHYLGVDSVELDFESVLVISRDNSASLFEQGADVHVRRLRFAEVFSIVLDQDFELVVISMARGDKLHEHEAVILGALLRELSPTLEGIIVEGSCHLASTIHGFIKSSGAACFVAAVIEVAGVACICEIGSRLLGVAEGLAAFYGRGGTVSVGNRLEFKGDDGAPYPWAVFLDADFGRAKPEMIAGQFSKNTWDEVSRNSLRLLVLGRDVRKIAQGAFRETQLASAELGGVLEVGDRAFYRCRFLSVISAKSCEKIGDFAFYSTGLRVVELFCHVALGEYCFASCLELHSVSLPSEVEFSPSGVFESSPSVKSLLFKPGGYDRARFSPKGFGPLTFLHSRIRHFGISFLRIGEVVSKMIPLKNCMASKVRVVGSDGELIVDFGTSFWRSGVGVVPIEWADWSKGLAKDRPFHLDLSGCDVGAIGREDLLPFVELRSFVAPRSLRILVDRTFGDFAFLLFVDLRPARGLLKIPESCFRCTPRLRKLLLSRWTRELPGILDGSGLREFDLSGLVRRLNLDFGRPNSLRTLICSKILLRKGAMMGLDNLEDLAFSGMLAGRLLKLRRLRFSGPVVFDDDLAPRGVAVFSELTACGDILGRPALPL